VHQHANFYFWFFVSCQKQFGSNYRVAEKYNGCTSLFAEACINGQSSPWDATAFSKINPELWKMVFYFANNK
jgi:hypothetical protein